MVGERVEHNSIAVTKTIKSLLLSLYQVKIYGPPVGDDLGTKLHKTLIPGAWKMVYMLLSTIVWYDIFLI